MKSNTANYVHVDPPDDKKSEIVIGRVNFSNNSLVYLGWKCPNCNTVWSPYVESCKNCIPVKDDKSSRPLVEYI